MKYDDPEALTPPERACQKAQVRTKRCAACVHRVYDGTVFEQPVLSCGIGLSWPKRGICSGFTLDMEGEE